MEIHRKGKTWVHKWLITLDLSALGAGSCKRPSVVFTDSNTLVIHDRARIFSYDMKTKGISVLSSLHTPSHFILWEVKDFRWHAWLPWYARSTPFQPSKVHCSLPIHPLSMCLSSCAMRDHLQEKEQRFKVPSVLSSMTIPNNHPHILHIQLQTHHAPSMIHTFLSLHNVVLRQ